MTKKEKAKKVVELLNDNYYMYDECYLQYNKDKPYELLFATILSAQCTDERVNKVTQDLFEKYKTLEDYANARISDMEKVVYTTGFYRAKAKSLIETSKILLDEFGGVLPDNIDDLLKLPGVGRKTANLILGHIYNVPSIVVDTHVKRVSKKLGLTENDDPTKVEFDLAKVLTKDSFIKYNTQVIALGREICKARSPQCGICFLNFLCKSYIGGKK